MKKNTLLKIAFISIIALFIFGIYNIITLDEITLKEGIKITMARYYSPSDTNIDKIGILADLEVKNIEIKPEEEQTYTDLYNSGILPEIATENPNMTENEIAKKAKELAKTYPIEERLLRRLIRVQLPNSASIVYDLDYDNQLQAALDVLKTKDFNSLLKSTKSLLYAFHNI